MAFVLFVLVLVAVGVVVWRRRADGPTKPAGLVPSLVDQGRDLLAPLFPSRPLNRRTLPRRLLRAAEQTVTIGVSGTVLVPSRIEISVNPEDLEPFTDALEWLRRDVGEALRLRAEANGWVVPSGPEVIIVADPDRPMRLPRAAGRLDAFHPDDVRTPPLPPSPSPADQPGPRPDPPAAPELTGRTSVVVGDNATHDGVDEPTVAAQRSFHLRLVAEGEPTGGGPADLNALLVAGAPLIMGRSREADLQVRNRQVSGRHCSLSVDPDDGPVTIEDLGSTNGTFVDGQRVDRAPLLPGATLRLGESSWRVELDPVNAA
jgi:predicted component of type VI protein secretion system